MCFIAQFGQNEYDRSSAVGPLCSGQHSQGTPSLFNNSPHCSPFTGGDKQHRGNASYFKGQLPQVNIQMFAAGSFSLDC